MKKTATLFVFLSLFVGTLSAQTENGNVLLGLSSSFGLLRPETGSGLSSFSTSTIKVKSDLDGFDPGEPDKQTNFNLSPRVGFFVTDNFAAGLDITFSSSVAKSGDFDIKSTESIFMVGPFLRYYIPSEQILPYIEVAGSLGTFTQKDEGQDSFFNAEQEDRVTSILGGVGVSVPLSQKALLDFLLGYSSVTTKAKENNDNNLRFVVGSVGVRIGLLFSI